jgi:hypothetical protein
MRTLFLAATLCCTIAAPALAQTGGRRAAPSTRATSEVSLTFADTAAQRAAGKPALIRINYGQPHLRGRTILSEQLVPLGQVWRLGANAATILTSDVDLTIGGKDVPRGRYVMQLLPERSGWTLILQQETTGNDEVMVMRHDPAKDFVRIPLTATTLSTPMESLIITLVPSTTEGAQTGDLAIMWGTAHLTTRWTVK